MRSKIVSALIGIAIGLPLSVCAAEARPDPAVHELNTTYHFDMPEQAPEVAEVEDTAEQIAEEEHQADLQLLACLVEAEAGNQDLTGKRLVVDVVLNRVADPRFPDTIAEVIFQPGQFGPVSNGALARAYYTVSEDSFKAVSMELTEQIDYSLLYFTAGGYGCGEPAYQYGDHYFGR
jgi:N-acetylmuramoyl-L-alanine amidase